VYVVAFSPDGKTLAAGGESIWIRLWDTATGTERAKIMSGLSNHDLAFDPQGKLLATIDHDRKILLWDLATLPKPGD
jgi:WD40 repeat protein